MVLAERLKAILFRTRSIPGRLGLRNYQVAIVVGTWAGANTGRGAKTESVIPLVESDGYPPKVREVNTEELALGNLGLGSVRIGPITPNFVGGGGNALSKIKPAVLSGQTVHVRLTGPDFPNGALFLIKSVNTDRALHWTIVASPIQEVSL